MESDYRFLTEHSYSMLDYDTLSLKQRVMKAKKSRATSNRSNKAQSTNRTVSVDRSSSDKENNSSTSTNVVRSTTTKTKSSAKKKSAANLKKAQDTKSSSKCGIKTTQGSIVKSKNKKIKSISSHPIDITDAPPSLSIEERVKLRRTTPFIKSAIPVSNTETKSKVKNSNKKVRKQMNLSTPKSNEIKSKKFFLGSGLDLDNIVLGNRSRRSVKI